MSGMAAEHARPGPSAPEAQLLVADSFRVRRHPRTGAAEVRGWGRHAARFTSSALAALPRPENDAADHAALQERIDAFLDEARARIAAYGEGFPRLELRAAPAPGGEPEFGLSLRPLPELRESIELRSAPGIRLDRPDRKGPNVDRLLALNRGLMAEALLLDDDGRAIEGATTSLVWWTDGTDASGRVIRSDARVASVTESILVDAAQRRLDRREPYSHPSGALSRRRPTLAELRRSEVWAVNALHGIRVVTRIDGIAQAAPDQHRLRWFRGALDRSWEPLEGWPARG